MTETRGGEVRVTIVERDDPQAFFVVSDAGTSNREGKTDLGAWLRDQLARTTANPIDIDGQEVIALQALMNEYLVPAERCETALGVARGRYSQGGETVFEDAVFMIIVAAIYPWPPEDGGHYLIATHPIGRWEDRDKALLEGLVSMAKQRFARESVLAQVAREQTKLAGRECTPMPVPGLRLRKPIEVTWGSEDGDDRPALNVLGWDLTSERGGRDWTPEVVGT